MSIRDIFGAGTSGLWNKQEAMRVQQQTVNASGEKENSMDGINPMSTLAIENNFANIAANENENGMGNTNTIAFETVNETTDVINTKRDTENIETAAISKTDTATIVGTASDSSTVSNANAAEIANIIDDIIATRKELLPKIELERSRVQDEAVSIDRLAREVDDLIPLCKDEYILDDIKQTQDNLKLFGCELGSYIGRLNELENEFARDTLNIGVSGAARVGKSTTLQGFTGLGDEQIPSGGLRPVTAVRSEIYNDAQRHEAVVIFRTESDFVGNYLRPHAENVNNCLKNNKLSIISLDSLVSTELPNKLEGKSVSTEATDSLKRLKEAQSSLDSYKDLLGAAPITVSLSEVRDYVTYPDPNAEDCELKGMGTCDRRYLAVDMAKIYCPFPNLGSAKVALVDLPGLGEIGNSANTIHLKGLESKVDQILLVMRPTDAKAFADNEVACNLNELNGIQPAVQRGDLVILGINKNEGDDQKVADSMRNHFEAEVNSGRVDRYDLEEYCATNNSDVSRLFDVLLARLGDRLPDMDRAKFDECMGGIDVSERVHVECNMLAQSMNDILRNIPSSSEVMLERINNIYNEIVRNLSDYAFELMGNADTESEAHKQLVEEVSTIHDEADSRIENGLFRRSSRDWENATCASGDYYNLYRDEDKRVRYGIIDAYCDLDAFYGEELDGFKNRVLDIILDACGMSDYPGFSQCDSADERIDTIASELGATLKSDNIDNALRLLRDMKYNFRSNVFLEIEQHLDNLYNPEDLVTGSSSSKRVLLGGEGSSAYKQQLLYNYVREDAKEANDGIKTALVSTGDTFNKYLAVSIDFFNNALYGRDEEVFKQATLRDLIREYKEYVLPDVDDASKSSLGQKAREIKDSAQALGGRHGGNVYGAARSSQRRNGTHAVKPQTAIASKSAPKAEKVADEGEIYAGEVYRVEDYGAFINLDDDAGRGLAHFSKIPNAERGRVGYTVGDTVRCSIISKTPKGLELRVVV